MADAASKGRVASGARHPSRTMPERYRKKLTAADVQLALKKCADGEDLADVGALFNVTAQAIRYHLRRSNGSFVR